MWGHRQRPTTTDALEGGQLTSVYTLNVGSSRSSAKDERLCKNFEILRFTNNHYDTRHCVGHTVINSRFYQIPIDS